MSSMLAVPVGIGSHSREWTTSIRHRRLVYLIGSVGGGMMTGIGIALLQFCLRLPRGEAVPAFLGSALVVSSRFAVSSRRYIPALLRVWWPHRRATVPREWMTTMTTRRFTFVYGLMTGSALLTHLRTPLVYGVVGVALMQPTPSCAVAIFSLYGLARGVTTVVLARRYHTPDDRLAPLRANQWGDIGHRWARRVAILACIP